MRPLSAVVRARRAASSAEGDIGSGIVGGGVGVGAGGVALENIWLIASPHISLGKIAAQAFGFTQQALLFGGILSLVGFALELGDALERAIAHDNVRIERSSVSQHVAIRPRRFAGGDVGPRAQCQMPPSGGKKQTGLAPTANMTGSPPGACSFQ